jgi:hypothetical protein
MFTNSVPFGQNLQLSFSIVCATIFITHYLEVLAPRDKANLTANTNSTDWPVLGLMAIDYQHYSKLKYKRKKKSNPVLGMTYTR